MSKGKLTPNTMMSASRLPGLLGHSKYSTPNDELTLSVKAIEGYEPEPLEIEAADWGNRFELHILNKSCEVLGLDDFNLDHTEAQYHANIPLCTSLDGTGFGRGRVVSTDPDKGIFVVGADSITLDGEGVLEAKLTGQDAEDVPPLWRGPIQLQGQMLVTGARWGAVCTLYRGTKLRIFLFERHEPTIEAITKACIEFDQKLTRYRDTGEIDYYPPHNSADANKLWPQGHDEVADLGDAGTRWAQEIIEAKQEIKDLQDLIEDRETKIKSMMQDATKGIAGRYKVTWPMRHYKPQPERVVPAKEGYSVRQSTITIKETA